MLTQLQSIKENEKKEKLSEEKKIIIKVTITFDLRYT